MQKGDKDPNTKFRSFACIRKGEGQTCRGQVMEDLTDRRWKKRDPERDGVLTEATLMLTDYANLRHYDIETEIDGHLGRQYLNVFKNGNIIGGSKGQQPVAISAEHCFR